VNKVFFVIFLCHAVNFELKVRDEVKESKKVKQKLIPRTQQG